jgi:hypothetical protein
MPFLAAIAISTTNPITKPITNHPKDYANLPLKELAELYEPSGRVTPRAAVARDPANAAA